MEEAVKRNARIFRLDTWFRFKDTFYGLGTDVRPLKKLVELYFLCIEPTSVNRQGEDEGTRYRTGIYYIEPEDRLTIMDVYRDVQHGYSSPLAVEVEPLESFEPANEYHQDYLEKHPDGYCHLPEALFEMARRANRKGER